MAQVVEMHPDRRQGPSDAKIQGISSHDVDMVIPKCFEIYVQSHQLFEQCLLISENILGS